MKTKIFSLLAGAGMMLGLGACTDNPDYIINDNDAEGSVNLSELGVEVDAAEIVVSRAGIETAGFMVQIVNAQGSAVYDATVATCKEIVTLPVADGYKVQVFSHEVENAAWSAPYYFGEKTFDIKANEITEIGTVTCTFSNIRVSVNYTDKLKELMGEDVTVAVKCSETGSELVFTPGEKRSAYFKALPGSTTLAAEFTGTVKNQSVSLVKALADVKAGQHRVITFDVRTPNPNVPDEFGGISVSGDGQGVKLGDGLYLFADVETVDVNGNVNSTETGDGSAQRPGKEDPKNDDDDPTPPGPVQGEPIKIESAGMSFDTQMDPTTVTDAVVTITADKGIRNLEVEIIPGGEAFEDVLKSVDVPLQFDLAHTKDQAERDAMVGFKFPVDEEVVNATSVKFDITEFVPLLAMYPGAPQFVLTVTDNEGNKLSKTLSFIVK